MDMDLWNLEKWLANKFLNIKVQKCLKNKKRLKCELNFKGNVYEERKVLGYKLMNFNIAYWKSILKIYRDGWNNT